MKPILMTSIFCLATFFVLGQTIEQKAFAQSYIYEKEEQYVKAIQAIESVLYDKSYAHNLRLAWLHYLQSNFQKSKTYYQTAARIMPLSIEARLGIVYPLSAMDNWGEVVEIYKEILKIDPQNTMVNYRLGSIFYAQEQYDKAFGYLEKVVNLYPFDYDGLILFSWCSLKLSKLKEAKSLFQTVLLLSPEDISAREGLTLIK